MVNGYMAFSIEQRKRIVAENPSMKANIGEVGKMIGKEWHALSEAEKAKYSKKGASMKTKTRKAKKVTTEEVSKKKKTRKSGRKMSGYMKFAQKVRPSIVKGDAKMQKDVTLVAKEIGKQWRELSEAEKKSYA